MMKQLILALLVFATFSTIAYSGEESGKGMKQVASTACPEWYGDNEWNAGLWGTYVFTNTDYNPNADLVDVVQSTTEGASVLGSFDKYIGNDHAWGGGGDVKYFFHRYFGVGVEGFVLDAHKSGFDIFEDPRAPIFTTIGTRHERAIGSALGTFTLRYPIACSRYAPYAWAGVGAIFGGGESDTVITRAIPGVPPGAFTVDARTRHFDGETKLLGQFGFGLEVRITRNIGWMNDLSWGVIDGPKNNFTMIRTGLNFAF
jgi:hypothetical protein